MTVMQQLEASHKCNTKLQQIVNKTDLLMKTEIIQVIAMSAHNDLPQYEGKWDKGWQLIRIQDRCTGKAGLYFGHGDYTIFNQDTYTAYSIRIGINFSMKMVNFLEV